MRSINLPLFDLFQRQRRYVVPLFQRPYVWKREEQWEPLWKDIIGCADAVLDRGARGSRGDKIGSHFLGAIVLNQIKVYGRQVDTVEVIDGQQRLTTLQIMLAAFRDEVRASTETRLADDLARLTENDGVRDAEVERFKVWPTNADRNDFEAAVATGSVQGLEAKYPVVKRKRVRKTDPRPRLVESYLFLLLEFESSVRRSLTGDRTTETPRRAPSSLPIAHTPSSKHSVDTSSSWLSSLKRTTTRRSSSKH